MTSSADRPEDDWNDATTASNYARFRPAYAPLAAAWARDFFRSVAGRERAALAIDAGCGPGLLSVQLAAFCDRVVAIDIAGEMLAEARRVSARPNIEYLQGDVRALPDVYGATGAPPADILVTGHAAHYADFDSDEFYKNARSVLRPGGVIAHFGYHHSGFNYPGIENLLDDFFDRVVIAERLDGFKKVKSGYRALFFPFPDAQYRSEEVIVNMTRDDVKNFLISNGPVFKDGDRSIEEFMTKDLPPGDQFGLKLHVFGRMAQLK